MFLILNECNIEGDREIVVNTDQVIGFGEEKYRDGTLKVLIKYTSGHYVYVKDSYNDLKIMMNATDSSPKIKE